MTKSRRLNSNELISDISDEARVALTGDLLIAHLRGDAKILVVFGLGEDGEAHGYISVHDSVRDTVESYREPYRKAMENAFSASVERLRRAEKVRA